MNRKNLPPFRGAWNRLPEYLKLTNETVQSLQISKTVVGEFNLSEESLVQGDNLIVGKKYIVHTLEAGDDFSNVGYVTEGVEFTATGSTPTAWTNNSEVVLVIRSIITYYNDLDSNIFIERDGENFYNIKITNSGFLNLKTFPNIVGGSSIEVVDSNTVRFNVQNSPKYFKIEVYN